MTNTEITIHNSLGKKIEALGEREHIGMYVCGPTVYDRPHIGNARSVVVYDVLFRLLKTHYGEAHVTYVRNITDVDDKINAAAQKLGCTIGALTSRVIQEFHEDMAALQCQQPTIEPKATEHISEIIAMVERLIASDYAYVAEGHVLFDVTSEAHDHWRYGMLSGRVLEEQEAGARVAVESYKRHPGDFVLWKPADEEDDVSSRFDSPWGVGRPGWHIECSAMSTRYLGTDFDIHGGGADLKFPHHENEIAQSCCANPGSHYARIWMHNGFLTVNGEKMSKSLDNFITVHELLERGFSGEVIRFALLGTHYSKPLDWTDKLVEDAAKQLDKLYRKMSGVTQSSEPSKAVLDALYHDMNVPKAIAALHGAEPAQLFASASLLGLLQEDPDVWKTRYDPAIYRNNATTAAPQEITLDPELIRSRINARKDAKHAKDWALADHIRDELQSQGIALIDLPDGTTDWKQL